MQNNVCGIAGSKKENIETIIFRLAIPIKENIIEAKDVILGKSSLKYSGLVVYNWA